MIRLRGHHLICLHFFNGEGYDAAFAANLEDVLKRAGSEYIEVCEGADMVCEKCPCLKDRKCEYDAHADKAIREMDREAMALLEVKNGSKVSWGEIKEKVPALFPRWSGEYCAECDWKKTCEKNQHYRKLKI
ncbi:MAG: DUF1284 domain-containing protein [Nitrospirae bacterium]|nr:DUF1284 domain-containing protein [Nitrospirota bacterium]